MSGTPIEPNENQNVEGNQNLFSSSILAKKRSELEIVRKEYFAAAEIVHQRQRELNEVWEDFGKFVSRKNSFVEIRDNLNEELRGKRKEIRQIELNLANAKEELEELEKHATNVRKEVPKADRAVTQAYQVHKYAKDRLLEAEESLELINQKVKDAEGAFLAVGGILPKEAILTLKEPVEKIEKVHGFVEKNRESPWGSGSFYIFAVVILMTLIAVISANVPWYALVIVVIGGLISISIVGALQLRYDEALSEENFIDLMAKSLKRLPLLRGSDNSEQKIERTQSSENSET